MRNLQHAASALALAVLVGCSQDKGTEIAAPLFDQETAASGPFAGGHANFVNLQLEEVSRSFHGREHDGVVSGTFVQWVTSVAGVRRENVGDIDCLRILNSQEAVLSGPIKENANPLLIGQTQIFRVYDDGEGSDAVDRAGGLVFRTAESGVNCQNFTPPDGSLIPISGGNIQVMP
jgi:hypothetical protein